MPGSGLHIGFIDLHDVGTGREEIADLLLTRGLGTRAASRAMKSSGSKMTCVVPLR
jgi:hypothetical protein